MSVVVAKFGRLLVNRLWHETSLLNCSRCIVYMYKCNRENRLQIWLIVVRLKFTAAKMCVHVCAGLQLRDNCAMEPCQNNATCIAVPTGYLDVVHVR